eukprot:1623617-Amphidinium_carterae.2
MDKSDHNLSLWPMEDRPEIRKRLDAGNLETPLDDRFWETALDKARGRGPIQHLTLLADRLGCIPQPGGWRCGEQYFTSYEAAYRGGKGGLLPHHVPMPTLAQGTTSCRITGG